MKRKHLLSLVVVALAGLIGIQAFAGEGPAREDTPAEPPISISSSF